MRREFLSGNRAIAEAAILSGLKFYAGYPITPASDLMEYLAEKLPRYGGIVVQFEDEIASINAAIGASWAGVKAMTATSGPGFSLMAEGVSLAVATETPVVVVDIMRAGPSTGIPTKATQSDVYQARWLAHGDYTIPVFAPWSVQDCYDMTIKSFNVAEKFRTPVVLLSDANIAHMWETLYVKEPGEVEIIERKKPSAPPDDYRPYKPDEDLVPPMAVFGEGYKVIVESLVHDELGYYRQDSETYREMVTRLNEKIRRGVGYIYEQEEYWVEDSDVVVVAYGSTARMVYPVVKALRQRGARVGFLRLKTLWPLNEEWLWKSLSRAGKVVVVENNTGRLYLDVARIAGSARTFFSPVITVDPPKFNEVMEAVARWL
ncbi:2-oxoglutarate ferredoxin oxidoreductase subunit alpha [Thermogladius calderae 1633]|uniref:2-oxoacid oxidoreductase (ferredoxin) n=1 Tax=Thermogladius calderae (strain DSM 22663 / VKM B-2946 / 1633) TaxID=1184251 RepID=I3TFW7_THEC1|nr:2-oxoacid:acceptor oxidoreductase subunit alpha [Thermogladius calderae]AFK51655.1 2-oxoglutarate ferredoxin oxidoreductase subunit alpha [Thermogladius calderae 1633]